MTPNGQQDIGIWVKRISKSHACTRCVSSRTPLQCTHSTRALMHTYKTHAYTHAHVRTHTRPSTRIRDSTTSSHASNAAPELLLPCPQTRSFYLSISTSLSSYLPRSNARAHTNTYTHEHAHAQTNKQVQTLTHTITRAHTRIHKRARTRAKARMRTQTHARARTWPALLQWISACGRRRLGWPVSTSTCASWSLASSPSPCSRRVEFCVCVGWEDSGWGGVGTDFLIAGMCFVLFR